VTKRCPDLALLADLLTGTRAEVVIAKGPVGRSYQAWLAAD
jgi:hypothetical protein